MKKKSSRVALCEIDQTIIESLACASDDIRRNQTMVCSLLPWVFILGDTFKDQDHLSNTVFLNSKWSSFLFMFPDLN